VRAGPTDYPVKRPTLQDEAWRDILKPRAARSDIVDGRRGYFERQFEVEQLQLTDDRFAHVRALQERW